ncbi:MAG: hypothetical protein ACRDF4_04635 [Rhabdochlamydiaceae bacterium]
MRTNPKILIGFGIVLAILVGLGAVGAVTGTTSTTTASRTPSSSPLAATSTSASASVSANTYSASNSHAIITSTATFTVPTSCHSVGGLPDPNCTPGAINLNVTQDNIQSTICTSGYTASIRPPESYTENLKKQSIQLYGYSNTSLSAYEEDHLIPLEVGGNPTSAANLWAEPHYGSYTSYMKDGFENYLNAMVCQGRMPLGQAQQEIASNWVQYWIAAGISKGSSAAGD